MQGGNREPGRGLSAGSGLSDGGVTDLGIVWDVPIWGRRREALSMISPMSTV